MPPVPPGQYEMTPLPKGFAEVKLTGLTEVEESKVITLTLQPAAISQTVTVSDSAPELTLDRADPA